MYRCAPASAVRFVPGMFLVRCGGLIIAALLALALGLPAGAAGPAYLVKDINTKPNPHSDSTPAKPIVVGPTLYFRADDGNSGVELWASDGTAVGTRLVRDINPGAGGSDPDSMV